MTTENTPNEVQLASSSTVTGDNNGDQLIAISTLKNFTEEEKRQMDTDGDGYVTAKELKAFSNSQVRGERTYTSEELKKITKFSQKTLDKLDHDGDGKISEGELQGYIRRTKSKLVRYKCYLGWSIFLFFAILLCTFLLGFELTRQFHVRTNSQSGTGTRRMRDRDGKPLSTVNIGIEFTLDDLFDDTIPNKNKNVDQLVNTFNNTLINTQISRTEITGNIATFYDHTGYVWFEYYRNQFNYTYNDTGTSIQGYWIMYRRSLDGTTTIIPKEEDTVRRLVGAANSSNRRKLLDSSGANCVIYPC